MALKKKTQKLKNCSNCGKLFLQTHGEKLCRECTIQEEEKQREIMDYIHDHQGCSITEVIENLNVSKKLVNNMINKGFFGNLKRSRSSYTCQSCGKPISVGNTYCRDCLKRLRSETKRIAEQREIRMNISANNNNRIEKPMSTIEKIDAQVEKELEIIREQRKKAAAAASKRSLYEAIMNQRGSRR
ncbi:MAG: hypothetical protein IJ862_00260 [Selenomonadaceae bacterium]|nr:hypothetical protein [Selenomonadaceae bacterium]